MIIKKFIPRIAVSALLGLFSSSLLHADVFTNVPEASAEGYQVLYELNAPTDAGYRDAVPVPYTVDNSSTAAAFDRVAYYIELVDSSNNTTWVYASMDAFTTVAKELGLPHNVDNPVLHQQVVENLNLVTNVTGLATGTSLDGAVVEMWPSNYSPARGPHFYAGSGVTFDWDDSGASANTAGYGSFQLHNPISNQVVFAYNRWGVSGGANDDIGIGSQSSGNPDYTSSATAGNYTTRKIVILTRPGSHVTFTDMPKNRSLHPRNLTTNKATIVVAGSETEGGYDNAVLRLYRNDVFVSETVQALTYVTGSAPFSFSTEITAELADYDFEVLLDNGGVRHIVRRSTDVVAGDAYLVYGQSNSEAARGLAVIATTTANGYASPWVRTFGQNADSGDATRNNLSWVQAEGDGWGQGIADPGAIGQWPIVLGRKIVDDHSIPVAILNGGRGGYNITQLQKDDAQPNNLDDNGVTKRTYNRLRFRAQQSDVADSARAIFYYQGESDNGDAPVHSNGFAALHADWAVDYPGLEHIYAVQVHVGCGVTQNDVALREVQRNFGDLYPNTSVMSTNGIQAHDGCHYAFTNGYEDIGLYHFAQVSRDLYNGPSGPDIDALNPSKVEFSNAAHTQILLTMRNTGATINFPAGALSDFALTGTSATITSYSVSGATITFNLSAPVTNEASLEYRGHTGGGDFVTNANGVGLLSFTENIGGEAPTVILVTPTMTRTANVNETITIQATATDGEAGPATRMVLLVHGVEKYEEMGNSLSTTWTVPSAGAHLIEIRAYDSEGNFGQANFTVLTDSLTSPGGVSSDLSVWLKAEIGVTKDANGFVSSWLDQSGNNNNATQALAGQQPHYSEFLLGNSPGLTFDGNDFITGLTGMPTGSYTKIVRFTLNSHTASNNLLSAAGAGTHALWYNSTNTARIFHSGNFVTSSIVTPVQTPSVLAATYDTTSNQGSIYVDNVIGGTATTVNDQSGNSYQVGGFANANYLDGTVSEVIIYNRVLTPAELTAVYNYLDNKYLTPYSLWLKDHTLTTGQEDPAKDGLSADVEYALGLDPSQDNAGTSHLPVVSQNGANIEVKYTIANDHPEAIVELQSSPNFEDWTTVTDALDSTNGVHDSRIYSYTPVSETKLFFRLRITVVK